MESNKSFDEELGNIPGTQTIATANDCTSTSPLSDCSTPSNTTFIRHSRQVTPVEARPGSKDKLFTIGGLNCTTMAGKAAKKLVDVLHGVEKRFVDDIICLSETKTNEFGLLVGGTHLLFSSSLGSYYGTGFLVHYQWKDSILRFKPLSDRLSYMDMYIRGYYFRIISAYLPSNTQQNKKKRTHYEHILFVQISNLLMETKTPFVIVGDFNARIGDFDITKRNWPGEQLLRFCTDRQLYFGNRYTNLERNLRYTFDGQTYKREIDYIILPIAPHPGSFTIKHDMFKKGATENKHLFNTDHFLIRCTFRLNDFSQMKTSFTPPNDVMEICYVLEWAMATGEIVILLLFKNVINKNSIETTLAKWGDSYERFMAVQVANCKYTFYDDGADLVVFTQTKREAEKILTVMKDFDGTPSYITNSNKLKLSEADLVELMEFQNTKLSLKADEYANENINFTKKKWNALVEHQRPINTLVCELAKLSIFKYETPLLKRLYIIRKRWMELSSTEELWNLTWNMCDHSGRPDAGIRENEKFLALLPILQCLEESNIHRRYLVFLESHSVNNMDNMKWRFRTLWTNPNVLIETWSNKIVILPKVKTSIRKAVNFAAKEFLNWLTQITISDDSYKNTAESIRCARSLGDKLKCEMHMECDQMVLQMESQTVTYYSKKLIEMYRAKRETLVNEVSVIEKVELYSRCVQDVFVAKMRLVPLKPIELAHIAHAEREILRNFLPNSEIPKDLPQAFIDFRVSYYRAKWRLVRDFRLAEHVKNLAEFVAGSIWMRDILWIGEHWIDIAKNEKAWSIALDIYLEVNVRPLDETDDYLGVVKAERENLKK